MAKVVSRQTRGKCAATRVLEVSNSRNSGVVLNARNRQAAYYTRSYVECSGLANCEHSRFKIRDLGGDGLIADNCFKVSPGVTPLCHSKGLPTLNYSEDYSRFSERLLRKLYLVQI